MEKKLIVFLKKKIPVVYIADLVFFSLLLWILVYARNKIFSYLVVLQQFSPQLADISASISIEDAASVAELEALLNVMQPIINEAKFFIFFLVPVLLFFLWVLFQGFTWNFLKGGSFRKAFDIKFYPKFAILSLPLFGIIYYLVTDFFNLVENFNLTKYIILLVLLFFVFYFTLASYLVLGEAGFWKGFVRLSIFKSKKFFPSYLLMVLILIVLSVFFLTVYISALSLAWPSFFSIIALLFLILLFGCSKCLLAYVSE